MFKAFLLLFLGGSVVVVNVLSMIYGWGLEPKSWGWIIGAVVYSVVITLASEAIKDAV